MLVERFCQVSRQRWPGGEPGRLRIGSEPSRGDRERGMECVCCGSAAITERRDRTAQGYRRFRCRDCGRQFNERSAGVLNRTCLPSDIIALRGALPPALPADPAGPGRDVCSLAASWSATKRYGTGRRSSLPVLAHELRQRRHGKAGAGGRSWYRRRDIPEGPGPLVLSVSGDRPAWGSDRHHAQRAPRHGCGQGILPVRNGRRRLDPGPRHHGRTWLLPESNPLDARPARASTGPAPT